MQLKHCNLDSLIHNSVVREEYKDKISMEFNNNNNNNNKQLSDYENFKNNIGNPNYLEDDEIAKWSNEQKDIRMKIINMSNITRAALSTLKQKRNQIRNQITKRIRLLKEQKKINIIIKIRINTKFKT